MRRKHFNITIEDGVFGLQSVKEFDDRLKEFSQKHIEYRLNPNDVDLSHSLKHQDSKELPLQNKHHHQRNSSFKSFLSNQTTNAETPFPRA